MNKRLVFGLNGLLGWHLFLASKAKNDVCGTYRRYLPEFEGRSFFRVDIREPHEIRSLLEETQPEIVYHAWSMCDLDVCESNPELAYEINVKGTENILKECEKNESVKKMVYISTDHIFDGERGNYAEDDEAYPKHVYGKTKLAAEKKVKSSSLPFLIIRPGLVIGKSVQGNKGPQDFLISRLKSGKKTRYFTDEYRTPLKAESFGQACVHLAESGAEGVYHLTGQKRWSRFDLAQEIATRSNISTKNITSYQRADDTLADIRPHDLSLCSNHLSPFEDFL